MGGTPSAVKSIIESSGARRASAAGRQSRSIIITGPRAAYPARPRVARVRGVASRGLLVPIAE
ncbi:hypothetical protein CQW49_13845 [Methylosinus trichosporium OB3b]|uniref:Uncharacterized protein n=1 Tax=Methylosinus trichosporium (strain ATCC 35070 / NCIMB 11131 / UNIQEM 75 / OB3b) TaxID=595536 RepID=A0A2D2D1F8_METT3|nr:hypothetical protein CQW49_13845 [Methylosinus trichosporium OB3b]OBS52250.1 hypothetical protein A8B73_11670 [Methylosinus sp. 3S-1]